MQPQAPLMRIAIRVTPGARRTRVGGRHGEGGDARLVVAVTAKAVDGRATAAALEAVADALGVRSRAVTLVSGATSRNKIVEVDDVDGLAERLAELTAGDPPAGRGRSARARPR